VLQEKWKKIGFAQRKENDTIWKEFRVLCDTFFEKKKGFYTARNQLLKVSKELKEKLIEKAKEIQKEDSWKETTAKFIALQEEWKKIGKTFQKDEQKLWQKFRGACDTFFNRKKEHFKEQDAAQEENLQLKLKLIEDIKAFQLSGKTGEDIKVLKEFSTLWNSIGHVPRKYMDETRDAYKKILDERFGILKKIGEDHAKLSYEMRIDMLKNAPDSKNLVKKEISMLRDKIRRLQTKANQYENNMNFFGKSAGAIALKNEVEKKVKATHREIQDIKKKLTLLHK
jgi:hypothetical protein